MAIAQVDTYQRRTKNGQVVTVKSHDRANADAAIQARSQPGRPPLAAQPGQFPQGRSIPGIFVAPTPDVEGVKPPLSNPAEHNEFGKRLPDHLRAMLEPEFDPKTGKPLKRETKSPSVKTQRVLAFATNVVLDDQNLIFLAGDGDS